jgi:phosphoribosylformylglycinamidine synthase
MGQIVGCLEGMGDACRALDFPIVSGNVSLYNESKATGGGSAILPTPAIGGVGLLADHDKMATIAFKAEGEAIYLVNNSDRIDGGHLGQSLWLREIHDREDGPPPPVHLEYEKKNAEFVRSAIELGLASAVHDVSDGGLAVALAEMALAGGIGAHIAVDEIDAGWAFGEDQGGYLISVPAESIDAFEELRLRSPVFIEHLGKTGSEALAFSRFVADDGEDVSLVAAVELSDLREANEAFFRDWMESGAGLDASDLSGN